LESEISIRITGLCLPLAISSTRSYEKQIHTCFNHVNIWIPDKYWNVLFVS
jgi:hypothetical protein